MAHNMGNRKQKREIPKFEQNGKLPRQYRQKSKKQSRVMVDYDECTVAFQARDLHPKVLFHGFQGTVYPAVLFYAEVLSELQVTFHGEQR